MLQCKSPQLTNSQVSTTCKYSMIFKTFDRDSDKILSKIGLLGKSFEQIGASIRQRKIEIDSLMGAMSKKDAKAEVGGFWSYVFGNKSIKEKPIDLSKFVDLDNSKASNLLKSLQEIEVASKTNTSVWQEYFSTLSDGQKWQIEFVKNNNLQKASTDDLVKANQQARASALAHNEAIKAQTLSAKASKVALKGLSVVANTITSIGLSLVASKVVSFIYDMATANEKLLNSAKELSNGFVQEKETIEDYKNKIEELKSIIDDNSSSYDKVSQARKDLMVVQDELIKKFGTEKETIDIITNAINDQSNALDELTKKQYQQWKNNFNDKSFAQSASDFLSSDNIGNAIYKLTEFDFSGAWEMLTAPTESNIDKMVDSMQYAYYKIEKTGNDTLDSLIAKTYDLYDDGSNFILDGNLDDIYEDLLEIQNLANDFDVSDSFETSITKVANAMDKTLKSYKEAYDTYILYEKILNESNTNQYDEQFNLINKAKEAYDNAVVSGNQNKIEEASDEYAKTLQSAIDLAMGNYDYDVADYFKAMYPELQQMFGEWQFSLNFEPNTDGLQDKVADALDSIDGVSDGTTSFSVEDIENFNPNVATQEQIDAYGELTNVAETYGLTVKQLIALLQTMGLIQSERYQELVDTFGQENVDKLSPEDLEIAYTIKNVGNMTFEQLQTEIQKVKDSTNENPISSISSTIDQLNTQLKPAFDSLKSAYQDIFTDDGFTLENVDLSMLDSIKSKLDELNKLEGANISIDYSSFENLARVLTDTSSTADDVQVAFNSLATDIVDALNPAISECSGENYKLVQSLLESVGIMNSEEVMVSSLGYTYEEYIAAKEETANAGFDLANATESEIDAFVREALESGNCGQALALLQLKKLLVNSTSINTASDIQQIMNLASAAGMGAEVLTQLANAKSILGAVESGGAVSLNSYQKALDDVQSAKQTMLDWKPVKVDFGNIGGGSKSAGSAGKEAADAYLESFEKELKDLDDLKDRGKITEKQYLDALRRLYLKYFRDKEKYLKEYEKYEHQYLEGMKSLYESAFSYITKQIDKRIDAVNSQKDAAVSALEAERDARLEAIEAQKEQYEHEIEGIEAQIEAKEKEIKAMQDANGERKRAIDLQKAEYELQRMQNQKTSFVYKDGQMVYEADTSGIRDAKQEVEDAKLEINISKIEKEIDRLEEEKDLLQERIDLLDKEAEQVNQYYDQLIAQTEKHYDAMVKGLEDYKSQFEALTDLLENAQLEASLSELGINMDALLSGSQEEFEKLKTAYIGILADMSRGNDGVLEQLSRLSGISTESISYLNATKGAFEELGNVTLEGLEESIGGIGESASTLSTSAGEASAAAGNIQESVSNMSQSIAPLNTELGNLKTLIGELIALLNSITFPEIGEEGYAQKLMDIAQAFGEIASKCGEFKNIDFSSIIGSASASGMDGAATTDGEGMGVQTGTGFMGLAFAISEAVTTIDEQMDNLQKALDIGNDSFAEQIRVITEEYIPAWEELQNRLAEIIGVGGGDGDNKEGKGSKKSGSKDGNSESGGNDGSIIGIMQTGGEEVATRLEDPWLKAFNDFATDGDNSIQTICNKIIELVSEMARIIQEKCEAAASALNALAKTASSSLHSVGGSVSGNTTPSDAEGTVGNAYAKGTEYKGLPYNEKNALRSEYGQTELTVYPDGKTELTTEPVMSDLPKGTVIFNEEQTKRIMGNKGEELGNAYDEGTVILADGTELRPLNPGDKEYWMVKKFDEFFKNNRDALLMPANAMFQAAESVDKMVDVINNNHSATQNITVNIGDINLQEVQDVNSLSREIVLRMPNMLLQEMHRI